jgi:PAS domain S-box-containing protein
MDPKVNILLIEDNPADSELVNIFLKSVYANKATLAIADSLDKGFRLIDDSVFDVIILDLSLPDSWGLDTFSKLHIKTPDTPIIVLTGIEDEKIGIDAVKMGAQDFLLKGKIKGSDLQRSINYSIERHKLLQSLAEKTNALYFEKQKLAEAQKLAHIGSWEWDIATKKISWSDEFFRIHGMQPQEEELSSDKLLAYVHPDDKDYLNNIIQDIIRTAKEMTFIYRIVRKDGAVRTLYSSGEVVKNDKGELIKVIGTGQDATDRIQEEEMEKLATAATKSFNSVIIADEHGNIEWVNEGFTTLTGYRLEEVKGSHGESLRKGGDTGISESASYYKRVIQEKMPITYESKNYSKQGREYWTITTLTPVLSRKGEVKRIIAIDSDITLRKQMEEDLLHANQIAEHSLMKGNKALNELMKAKKQLEESVRVKEQFLANMSHEIRTPMNAIVGFTDLILKTQLSLEQKQYTDAIKTSGENLIVIINDILDFSKMQSGKISFEQIEFSISQLIATLTELMLPKSAEKNIKLSKSIDKKMPDRLIGDPTRLNQILLNLVGNAIKFTQKGEVKITVEQVSDNNDTVNLRFSVSDSGIGIPQDKLPNIFDAFTQATYDTTRKYGGTGLGLAIVKQLIELQGGDIKVTSHVNKGSVFTFSLVYRKNLKPEATKKVSLNESEDVIKELNVLLVEDNILNQVLAQKVLSDWGWKTDVADNGLIAVEKIEKQNFDLVLMDIQLPEMDGYEATHHIREKLLPPKSTIPIIAMTAHAISGEEEKCIKAGMNGYISKPFNTHKLYQKIISVLNMKGNGTHTNNEEQNTMNNNNSHKHTDLTYLRKLANGSDEFITQMLTLFIEQTPDAVGRMEKHLQEHNWELLGKVAHKMKPSIMFVGLKELEKDVKAVEEYASGETNTDELPVMISHIKAVCNEAIVELKEEMLHLH